MWSCEEEKMVKHRIIQFLLEFKKMGTVLILMLTEVFLPVGFKVNLSQALES